MATLQREGFPIASARERARCLSTEMMTDEGWQRTRTLQLQPVILSKLSVILPWKLTGKNSVGLLLAFADGLNGNPAPGLCSVRAAG